MDVIKKKHWWQSDQLKWSVIGLLGLLVGYLVVLMYVQGEYLFAIMTLILSSAGLYIFANRKTYAWRYVYPGLAGMGLFVLFPLVCTIAIAFTNYSSTNQLTFERAQQVLMDRSYQAGKTYNFGLYPSGDEWQLALTDGETGKHYLSDAFSFGGEQKLQLKETDALPGGERANLRIITQNRLALNQITAVLPDESKVIMSSLRQFSGTRPLYTLADDGLLTNNQSGVKYRPNNDSGYYQSINADGSWGDEKLSPGYTVTIGAKNFTRVFTDEGIQKPFFAIFVWNNFVLIQLLTNGGPDRLGTTTPAGYTDLLVSYTYRIAFEGGGGQDFGLAAAIATLIFLLVGALAIVNLKATRMKFD
ncbi:maltose ABC transporter permease MalF [Salmonella enterica subsp. enterica]|nr:maltose ABC transporter permease MalF [Salmonella enterica subsp. enterica serovar Perth]